MKRNVFKALVLTVTVLSVFLFQSCVAENTAVYFSDRELDGINIHEVMTFNAKGDSIYRITDEMSFDLSSLEQTTAQSFADVFKASVADAYSEIDGAECSDDFSNGVYTVKAVIQVSEDSLEQLSQSGLMEFTGSGRGLSLEITGRALAESGYTLLTE